MMMRLFLIAFFVLSENLVAQDEEPSREWDLSVAGRYHSLYTNYGLDLSNDRSALGYEFGVTHLSGFSTTVNAIQTLGAGGQLQQWSLGIGYDWQASEWVVLSAEYTHYEYSNDSVNVLAGLSNGLSFSLELSLGDVDLGFSYDTFLGSNSASYYGMDLSGYYKFKDLMIVPLAQVTFMAQEIQNSLLNPGKKGSSSGTTTTSTVTGLSSFSIHLVLVYPLLEQLSLSAHPSFLYSPKAEVSSRASQFVWSVGFRFSF